MIKVQNKESSDIRPLPKTFRGEKLFFFKESVLLFNCQVSKFPKANTLEPLLATLESAVRLL
jgi:hypothetical protein